MKLKDIIEKIMIPESKAFLNELDEMIKNSQPKDNIILVETEFENKDDDPFNRLEKTRNINIIRKI